jgi:hypothetical protein
MLLQISWRIIQIKALNAIWVWEFQDENSDITSSNSCVLFIVGIDLVSLSNVSVWCSNCKSVDSFKVGNDHNIEETLSQELFDR